MAGKRHYRGRDWVTSLPEDDVDTTMGMRRRDAIQFRKLAEALGLRNLKTTMGRLADALTANEYTVNAIRDLILESEAKAKSVSQNP